MAYSNWQLDRLRSGLNSYRIANGKNGRLLSWRLVADHVMLCPKVTLVSPINGEKQIIRGEPLRRFAAGEVDPDYLDDIGRFLVFEGLLDESELEQGNPGTRQFLTAVLALGRQEKASHETLRRISREYVFEHDGKKVVEERRLFLTADKTNPICSVEERITVRRTSAFGRKRDIEPLMCVTNQGYGCLFSAEAKLMIYLSDEQNTDHAALFEEEIVRDETKKFCVVLRRVDRTLKDCDGMEIQNPFIFFAP